MRYRCTLLTFFFAFAAPAAPLTLPEALGEAHAHGFDLRTAELAIEQARGDRLTAGALANPTLTVGAGPSLGCYGPGCRAGSPTLTAGVSDQGALSQVLVGKRGLRVEAAQAGVASAEAQREDSQRQLDSLIKQQFVAAVTAERATQFSQQVRDSTAQTAALIRERYQAGAVDEADVSRVETQRFEAEQALDGSRQNAEAQRSLLAFLLGRESGAQALTLEPGLFTRTAVSPELDHATLADLVTRALERRPDVRAQAAAVQQAEATVASLERQRVPDVALGATFAQQGLSPDFSSPPNVVVSLSLPLPVVYRFEGELTRARATVQAQRVALEKARAQVRTDVETAWAAFQAAHLQSRRMDESLLRQAERARTLVSLQYDKGAASLIEFLDAQRTFVAINVESLTVVQAWWTAVFRLEAAVGQEFLP
jgi:cobalt-zinc-cadmium efflux system outer membrane protein